MEGNVWDKVVCKGTGGEKERSGVDEDEGNGGGAEREGSLMDERSSGRDEGSGSGFMGDIGLGEVGAEREETEEGATVEEDTGCVEEEAGQKLGCLGGGGGKGSLDGD